jgi:hypothetical protein
VVPSFWRHHTARRAEKTRISTFAKIIAASKDFFVNSTDFL